MRILITEPIVSEVVDFLRKDFEVDVGRRGEFNSEQALTEAIPDYDALIPMLSNPVTAGVIEAGEQLRIIANHAVGYNNIDMEAAGEHEIVVANTPGVLTEACADFAMTLLLGVTRRIREAEEYLRQGRFEGWEPLGFLGMELGDRILGIYGMGRIGTAFARRARAFGMKVRYHNRSKTDPEIEKELEARYIDSLEELAAGSDVLSLNCPLTEQTHHAIDRDILERMPGHSVLVNTSRGAVVDEAALAEALHEGIIGGAGLDVFEEEPEVHPRLLTAPNCLVTPHMASATHRTRRSIGMLAARAVRDFLAGRPAGEIPNVVAG